MSSSEASGFSSLPSHLRRRCAASTSFTYHVTLPRSIRAEAGRAASARGDSRSDSSGSSPGACAGAQPLPTMGPTWSVGARVRQRHASPSAVSAATRAHTCTSHPYCKTSLREPERSLSAMSSRDCQSSFAASAPSLPPKALPRLAAVDSHQVASRRESTSARIESSHAGALVSPHDGHSDARQEPRLVAQRSAFESSGHFGGVLECS